MTKKSSLNSQIASSATHNSRYTLPVDNYAKAPLRRLFHFVAVSLRIDTTRNSLIRHRLTHSYFPAKHKPLIINSFHTLPKTYGGIPYPFRITTVAAIDTICAPPPCSRDRFPDRGPFHRVLAQIVR